MAEHARRSFGERELIDLTLAIIAINGWNRLAISFRTVPGTYQPAAKNTGGIEAQGSQAHESEHVDPQANRVKKYVTNP